jgi:tRNA pseudouridine13 synthase
VDSSWLEAALRPPRAYGTPLAAGILRVEPEDFAVEEELGFAPSGSGQHVLLKVRKRNANTQWVARELAKACGCRPADVGYAGLKDRRAVATQWFSAPQSRLSLDTWRSVSSPEFEVLEAHAHSRKLPRGALAGNRFVIRIRHFDVDDAQLAARLSEISRRGVPNYFGPQRFGRNGSNLARISETLQRADRGPRQGSDRGFVLSAARSLVFNAVLGQRVADGTWERLEAGDLANLDGRGSVFAVEDLDPTLTDRCERLEIHPTGPLWGRGEPPSRGRVLELESRIAAQFSEASSLATEAGMEQERRSLRLAVRELRWEREDGTVTVSFRLARGSFATAVLRELVDSEPLEADG